jgi:hypothetical protein
MGGEGRMWKPKKQGEKTQIKERAPGAHWMGGVVGPHNRSGRFLEEKNDSCHCRESSHDFFGRPLRSHYVDKAIPVQQLTADPHVAWAWTQQIPAYNYAQCTHFTQRTRHKRVQSHSSQDSKSNSNCNSPILQRVTGSLQHRTSVHCLVTINHLNL